jgi:diguanylate cyclase (GGDEF)-like protein
MSETSLAPSDTLLLDIIAAQTELVRIGPDFGAIMAAVTHHAARLTCADGGVVELADGDEMVYRAVSGIAAGQLGLRIPLPGSLSGLCVKTHTPVVCDDALTDERVNRAACQRVGIRSMLVAPLMHGDYCVGVLKVIAGRPGAFGQDDFRTLSLLTEFIAASMFHAASLDVNELYRRATRDPLTGLANRAFFFDRFRQLVSHARRNEETFGLLSIDKDGLKAINDQLGHRAGDCAIVTTAGALQTACRETDTVARIGGDEFAILVTSSPTYPALTQQAERVAREVSNAGALHDGQSLQLGVSIGMALFPCDAAEIDALVEFADRAMYDAKRRTKALRAADNEFPAVA